MAAIATLGEAENHPTTPITALEMPIREEIPALNRRVLPRTKATFGVFIEELGQEVSGLDISFGGLMAVAEEPIWPGNLVDLHLKLPGEDESIAVEARVVDLVSHPSGVAMRMRFETVAHTARKQIAIWMSRRNQR